MTIMGAYIVTEKNENGEKNEKKIWFIHPRRYYGIDACGVLLLLPRRIYDSAKFLDSGGFDRDAYGVYGTV